MNERSELESAVIEAAVRYVKFKAEYSDAFLREHEGERPPRRSREAHEDMIIALQDLTDAVDALMEAKG